MGFFLLRWVVLPVLIAAGAFAAGWRVDEWRHASQAVKAVERVVYVTQNQGAITAHVAVAAQAQHDRIVYRTQTLIKEVPQYVTAKADAGCIVPLGFVRLWNGAASGLPSIPESAAEPNDAPSGVALSEVGRADVANFGAGAANAAQLAALQDWIRKQQAAFANH